MAILSELPLTSSHLNTIPFRIDSDSLLAVLNEAKAGVAKANADQTKILADQVRYKTLMATVSTTESVRVDFALSERDYLELVRPILESGQAPPGMFGRMRAVIKQK